jgi:hypothetical protein
MAVAKQWRVEIFIDEHEQRTRARARLHNPDDTMLVGVGLARLNPADVHVPEIGDELAVARALSDRAHQLPGATADDIEAITQHPVRVPR